MPNPIDSLLRQAEALQAAGETSRAIAAYRDILVSYPEAVYAHLRHSEALQAAGRYRESRAGALAAEKALRRTRRWEALPFVTQRLLAFEERERMRRLILEMDPRHPVMVSQSPVLSQHLWLCEAFDEAIDLVDRASAAAGDSALLSYSRANALRYSGRVAEATAELEHCLALDPLHPQAHWTLAYHQAANPVGSRVDRVRKARDAQPEGSSGRVFLDFALFKELDDAGDTTAAWHALAQGLRGKRASLRYDATAQAAALAGLARAALASARSGDRAAADAADEGIVPLFVVGLPRTGTTLVEHILSNHPDVAAAGELGDFTQALDAVVDRFVASPPDLAAQALIADADLAAVGRGYLERVSARAGDRRFLVDKNPSNVFHAASILRALPQARVLCLVRDPMDACFSGLKELFPGQAYAHSYDQAEMAAHHQGFRRLVDALGEAFPERFQAVGYEALVAHPEAEAARVAAWCGLSPQAGLSDTAANERPVLTASASQVRDPIHARNVGAWQRYASQLATLRQGLGEA